MTEREELEQLRQKYQTPQTQQAPQVSGERAELEQYRAKYGQVKSSPFSAPSALPAASFGVSSADSFPVERNTSLLERPDKVWTGTPPTIGQQEYFPVGETGAALDAKKKGLLQTLLGDLAFGFGDFITTPDPNDPGRITMDLARQVQSEIGNLPEPKDRTYASNVGRDIAGLLPYLNPAGPVRFGLEAAIHPRESVEAVGDAYRHTAGAIGATGLLLDIGGKMAEAKGTVNVWDIIPDDIKKQILEKEKKAGRKSWRENTVGNILGLAAPAMVGHVATGGMKLPSKTPFGRGRRFSKTETAYPDYKQGNRHENYLGHREPSPKKKGLPFHPLGVEVKTAPGTKGAMLTGRVKGGKVVRRGDIEVYENPKTYKSIIENEGRDAADAVLSLHDKNIPTMETHRSGNIVDIRIWPLEKVNVSKVRGDVTYGPSGFKDGTYSLRGTPEAIKKQSQLFESETPQHREPSFDINYPINEEPPPRLYGRPNLDKLSGKVVGKSEQVPTVESKPVSQAPPKVSGKEAWEVNLEREVVEHLKSGRKWSGNDIELYKAKRLDGLSKFEAAEYASTVPTRSDPYYRQYAESYYKTMERNYPELKDTPSEKIYKDAYDKLEKRRQISKPVSQEPSKVSGKEALPKSVIRIEEPGVGRATVDKPHGVYTTPEGVKSPHAELGGKTYKWDVNPDANVLSLDASKPFPSKTRDRGGLIGNSAGNVALQKFIGMKEFLRLESLSKSELINHLKEKYPDVDWHKYHDNIGLLEGYAGKLAREKGYDAIYGFDKHFPEFNEYVGLTDRAFKPPSLAPTKPKSGKPKVETPKTEIPKTEPPEKTIGLKKTEIEKLSESLETKKLAPEERKTHERNLSEAKESKLDETALDLADEVIKTKRQISSQEHAGMVIKAGKIKTEYDNITKTIGELIEKGNLEGAKRERARRDIARDQMEKLLEASDLAGRESARALSIRRMLLNTEDLSLAHSLVEAKALKGKPLRPKEVARIEKAANEYESLQKRYDELVKKHDAEVANRDRVVAERVAAYYEKRGKVRQKTAGERIRIQADRKNIKKQIAALGMRVNDITGLTPEASYLVGRLALSYVREGVVGLKQIAKKVMADLPEISEHDVYRAINAKNPNLQKRAKVEVTKNVNRVKREARILDEISTSDKALKAKLRELQDLAYKTADAKRLEKSLKLINEIRDNIEAGISTKEQIKHLRSIVDTETKLLDLNKQLETGDFKITQKATPKWMPKELERAQVELKTARRRVRQSIDAVQPWTKKRVGLEVINTLRTAKATADMSGTFRQGLISIIHDPKAGAVNFIKAVKATFSKYEAERIDNMIRSMDTHYLREKAKLHLSELEGRATAKEEMFMSNVLEKIPVVKEIVGASNRHMTTFLNLMRTSMFDDFVAKYPNATHAELKAWADWINVCTGRGNLSPSVANGLSTVFFAPKFAVSRIQTPYMLYKHFKNKRVRKEIAIDLTKLAATGVAALTLAEWGGADVSLDPRESDFGKMRIGNTRVDMWAGIQQPVRVVARIGAGVTDQAGWTGKHLTDSQKEIDPLELIYRFSSYKLAPSITVPVELYKGKTIVGEETTIPQTLVRSVTPMFIEDVKDAWKDAGMGRAAWVGGATFMGVGANTYEDSQTQVRRNIAKLLSQGKKNEAKKKAGQWNRAHKDDKIVKVNGVTVSGGSASLYNIKTGNY